jgi:hypothetical protein
MKNLLKRKTSSLLFLAVSAQSSCNLEDLMLRRRYMVSYARKFESGRLISSVVWLVIT